MATRLFQQVGSHRGQAVAVSPWPCGREQRCPSVLERAPLSNPPPGHCAGWREPARPCSGSHPPSSRRGAILHACASSRVRCLTGGPTMHLQTCHLLRTFKSTQRSLPWAERQPLSCLLWPKQRRFVGARLLAWEGGTSLDPQTGRGTQPTGLYLCLRDSVTRVPGAQAVVTCFLPLFFFFKCFY